MNYFQEGSIVIRHLGIFENHHTAYCPHQWEILIFIYLRHHNRCDKKMGWGVVIQEEMSLFWTAYYVFQNSFLSFPWKLSFIFIGLYFIILSSFKSTFSRNASSPHWRFWISAYYRLFPTSPIILTGFNVSEYSLKWMYLYFSDLDFCSIWFM